jgi:hypothetical protein
MTANYFAEIASDESIFDRFLEVILTGRIFNMMLAGVILIVIGLFLIASSFSIA